MALILSNDPGAQCTLCRHVAYALLWRPEQYYPAGSRLELRAGSLRSFLSWRLVSARMTEGDIVYRWKVQPAVSEIWANSERALFRARLHYGAQPGQEYPIHLTVIPPLLAGLDQHLSVWTGAPSDVLQTDAPLPPAIREEGSECALHVTAGPVERMALYARPIASAAGVEAIISPQDRFGNPARFARPIPVQLQWGESTSTVEVQGTTAVNLPAQKQLTRAQVRVPLRKLAPEENIANGRWEGEWCSITGNPVIPAPVGDLRPVFGDIHWHTDISGDGLRSIEQALQSARDEVMLDFAAPSDHNPGSDAWAQTVSALERFHEPGRFATFFGWENSTDLGHENYYFTAADHPLICGGSAGIITGRPRDLLKTLGEQKDFLAVPHHTNAVSETRRLDDDAPFWHPYAWTAPTHAHRLVEVFQSRGNQERNDYADAWQGWHQHNGAAVQDALAKGYRLGFLGGTDNHCGWPGRADYDANGEGNEIRPLSCHILTGVWAPALDRQPLFDSLSARHTWAVWNTRALVWFTVNTALMGDELRVPRGTPLTASVRIHAEAPFQVIEIVSEGKVVWQESSDAPDYETAVDLGASASTTHYYLRALLRNGAILYASPIFIDVSGEGSP